MMRRPVSPCPTTPCPLSFHLGARVTRGTASVPPSLPLPRQRHLPHAALPPRRQFALARREIRHPRPAALAAADCSPPAPLPSSQLWGSSPRSRLPLRPSAPPPLLALPLTSSLRQRRRPSAATRWPSPSRLPQSRCRPGRRRSPSPRRQQATPLDPTRTHWAPPSRHPLSSRRSRRPCRHGRHFGCYSLLKQSARPLGH